MEKFLKILLFGTGGALIAFIVYNTYLFKSEGSQTPRADSGENQASNSSPLSSAEKTLEKLTLNQKIGQMLIIGFEGKELTPQLEFLIREIQPGGIALLKRNLDNDDQLKKLIKDLQKISLENTGLPLFVAADQEGGEICRIEWLKEKTAQAKIKNKDQAFQIGLKRGKELLDLGINLNFAPVLDESKPGDFLYERSFQKSPQEAGELAKSLVLGQKESKIFTAIKHFPGYGGISFNPERAKLPFLSEIPEVSQFKTALEANPEMVMTSNVIYSIIDKDIPFTLSPNGINFLEKEAGNNLLFISDDLSSPVLKKEFSLEKTVILAAEAGIDILIVVGFDRPEDALDAFEFLVKAAGKGDVSEGKINQSALGIIKLKEKLLK